MKTYAIFNDSFFQKKPGWMPEKLYRAVCQRANPRSKAYMLTLLYEKFPEAELIDLEQPRSSAKIVLLYPDAIGLGWGKIEERIKAETKNPIVLNGRRKVFDLIPSVHRKLLLYRFLEITFLPEILLMPFILLYGALIAIKDKFRVVNHD